MCNSHHTLRIDHRLPETEYSPLRPLRLRVMLLRKTGRHHAETQWPRRKTRFDAANGQLPTGRIKKWRDTGPSVSNVVTQRALLQWFATTCVSEISGMRTMKTGIKNHSFGGLLAIQHGVATGGPCVSLPVRPRKQAARRELGVRRKNPYGNQGRRGVSKMRGVNQLTAT